MAHEGDQLVKKREPLDAASYVHANIANPGETPLTFSTFKSLIRNGILFFF
jgi:hypothetical protein